MVITYLDGDGLLVEGHDLEAAREAAERWLLDEGAPAIAVAQLDVPRAPARAARWDGSTLTEDEDGQAVTVVEVPRP